MKTTGDPEKVSAVLKQYEILSHFTQKEQPFFLASFEKGEEINRRLSPKDNLLFLLKGTAVIYGIREDGSMRAVTDVKAPALFGDLEFIHPDISIYNVRLETQAFFAVLPLKEAGDGLKKDPEFLLYLLDSIARKMELITASMNEPADLKEKVLWTMQVQWGGILQGTEKAATLLACSRRQLQRILVQLCREGIIEKTGRGKYRLKRKKEVI